MLSTIYIGENIMCKVNLVCIKQKQHKYITLYIMQIQKYME